MSRLEPPEYLATKQRQEPSSRSGSAGKTPRRGSFPETPDSDGPRNHHPRACTTRSPPAPAPTPPGARRSPPTPDAVSAGPHCPRHVGKSHWFRGSDCGANPQSRTDALAWERARTCGAEAEGGYLLISPPNFLFPFSLLCEGGEEEEREGSVSPSVPRGEEQRSRNQSDRRRHRPSPVHPPFRRSSHRNRFESPTIVPDPLPPSLSLSLLRSLWPPAFSPDREAAAAAAARAPCCRLKF